MKTDFIRIIIYTICAGTLFYSCSKDKDTEPTPNNPGTGSNPARDSALMDYNLNYLGSAISNPGWTGSTSTCTAGSVSQASHDAVINRINYFRRMVGLNDNCTLDTTLFAQEQETALMMSANNQLSHSPPNTWLCYTSSGASGAASSNIALGYNSSAAISAFIRDNGSGNQDVGHRRWILHSRKEKFSYGSTSNAMALYVFASGSNTVIPEYIAFPPDGYIPQTLVPGRWSFGIPLANFSAATVTMTGPSGTVPLTIVSSTASYGDKTIVWEPTGIDLTNTNDVTYTITVSGITGALQTSYTYSSKIFKP
jgi:uncharacterized protein YkwD